MLQRFILILPLTALSTSLAAEVVCPVPWWYCLNRDPKDLGQVRAVDNSNRSISWGWDSGSGRWEEGYQHSFPTGSYAIDACYTGYRDGRASCVSYNTARSWQSDERPISASAWDMSYNGDNFGFQPGPNGQYVFHIYSRNLHYNPWVMNGGGGNGGGINDQMKNCEDTGQERTQGNGWWLERKSTKQCPVVVSSGELVSPMEWSWLTTAGRWKVFYRWGRGDGVNCSVDYTPSGSETSRIISWQFYNNRLILSYTSLPRRIYREQAWKLMASGGETWGFTPTIEGSWIFSVYSRNVIIRPFEKSSGSFNLQ